MADYSLLKTIFMIIITLNISSLYSQDRLGSVYLERYKIVSGELSSLVSEFLSKEAACIDISDKNTVPAISYTTNTGSDTNIIELGVVAARNIIFEDYVGYLRHDGYDIFLYEGTENLVLLEKLKSQKFVKEFKISQRIVYGNYLLSGNDTVYLVGPEPYWVAWRIWQYEFSYLYVGKVKINCEIKRREKRIQEMIESGDYRMPHAR